MISSLLLEKELAREKYRNRIDQLSDVATDLKTKLKSLQEKRGKLISKDQSQEQDMVKAKAEIEQLEKELNKWKRK